MKQKSKNYFLLLWGCIGLMTSVNTASNDYPSLNEVESSPNYKFQAKTNQFPWIVTFKTLHRCMGTLIHPSWVMTAASCLEHSSDPSYYQLQLGYPDVTSVKKGEVRTASELHPYPRYRSSQVGQIRDYANNIALMKLETPFKNRVTLTPRYTPLMSDKSRMRVCTVVGLVKEMTNPNENAQVLQFTRVFAFTFEDCLYKFGGKKKITGMWNTMCVMGAGENSLKGCSGDPGGPLICPMKEKEWTDSIEVELAGVSSWNEFGVYCGSMSRYTDVGRFSKWFNDTMTKRNISERLDISGRSEEIEMKCATAVTSPNTILFQSGLAISLRLSIFSKPNPLSFIFS